MAGPDTERGQEESNAPPDQRTARERRRLEAADPAASARRLRRLGRWWKRDAHVARALAANPATPPSVLRDLARCPLANSTATIDRARWDVRALAVSHPACPARAVASASRKEPRSVREAVARSEHTPVAVLRNLTRSDLPVRLALSTNPTATPEIIATLMADRDEYVRGRAAAHPAAGVDALLRLSDDFAAAPWVLRNVAINPSCPQDRAEQILTWLTLLGPEASDPTFDPVTCAGHPGKRDIDAWTWYRSVAEGLQHPEDHVLWRVRQNAVTSRARIPYKMLEKLALDESEPVRLSAARFDGLSTVTLRELSQDAAPVVAATATSALERKRKKAKQTPILRRLARPNNVRRIVILLVAVAALAWTNTPHDSPSYTRPTVDRSFDSFTSTIVHPTMTTAAGSGPTAARAGMVDLPDGVTLKVMEPTSTTSGTKLPLEFTAGDQHVIVSVVGVIIGGNGDPVIPVPFPLDPHQKEQTALPTTGLDLVLVTLGTSTGNQAVTIDVSEVL
ncbi:MAG: hypothetical protein ACXWB2_15190 [Acidimicrobiales bacterium]